MYRDCGRAELSNSERSGKGGKRRLQIERDYREARNLMGEGDGG